RPRAPAGSVAARLGAVRIAVGAGALDAGMLRAESRRAAAVGAIAEQAVVARRSLGFALAAGRAAIAAGGVAVVALLADLDHVISAVGLEEADVQEIAVELLAAVRRYADVVLAGRQPVLQPRAQRNPRVVVERDTRQIVSVRRAGSAGAGLAQGDDRIARAAAESVGGLREQHARARDLERVGVERSGRKTAFEVSAAANV